MDSEKNKLQSLYEDLQLGSNNYLGVGGGPGQSAMTLKPGKVTLLDLIDQAKNWEEQMSRAPNRLPFPLQDGLSDQLGELYIGATDIKSKVAQSAKFSIIKDNENMMNAVKKIHKRLSLIEQEIRNVVKDLDQLGVDTATGTDHA